jgi:hypothetical protein
MSRERWARVFDKICGGWMLNDHVDGREMRMGKGRVGMDLVVRALE